VEGIVFAAMAAAALLAGAVGLRLLWLRSRRAAPLRLLGAGLVLGSGVNHLLILLVAAMAPPRGSALREALLMGSILCVGAGATAISRFNHVVYRPKNVALHAVTAMIASYFAVIALLRVFGAPVVGPLAGLALFPVLLAVYGWSGYEALACYAAYRKAPRLDPLVVDRFRVWGIGTLCTMGWVLAVWIGGGHVIARALGALFALLLAFAVLFAFVPPRWYRRRVNASAVGVA
jgi:hypothetical protein